MKNIRHEYGCSKEIQLYSWNSHGLQEIMGSTENTINANFFSPLEVKDSFCALVYIIVVGLNEPILPI